MAGNDLYFSPTGRGGNHYFDNDGDKPKDAVLVPPAEIETVIQMAGQGPAAVAAHLGIAVPAPQVQAPPPAAAPAAPLRIMRYSPTTRGFYPSNRHYPDLPGDLIEMSDADYRALIAGQHKGDIIDHRPGQLPVLKPRPAPTDD